MRLLRGGRLDGPSGPWSQQLESQLCGRPLPILGNFMRGSAIFACKLSTERGTCQGRYSHQDNIANSTAFEVYLAKQRRHAEQSEISSKLATRICRYQAGRCGSDRTLEPPAALRRFSCVAARYYFADLVRERLGNGSRRCITQFPVLV